MSVGTFTLVLLGLQLVATALSGLHKWISKRESEPQMRRQTDKEMEKIIKRQDAIEKRMNDHDERSSQKMSYIQKKLGSIELDMRELKTLQRMHGPASGV